MHKRRESRASYGALGFPFVLVTFMWRRNTAHTVCSTNPSVSPEENASCEALQSTLSVHCAVCETPKPVPAGTMEFSHLANLDRPSFGTAAEQS